MVPSYISQGTDGYGIFYNNMPKQCIYNIEKHCSIILDIIKNNEKHIIYLFLCFTSAFQFK
jgi:hypothetical protein